MKLTKKEIERIREYLQRILDSGGSRSEDIESVSELSEMLLGVVPKYNHQTDEWSFEV